MPQTGEALGQRERHKQVGSHGHLRSLIDTRHFSLLGQDDVFEAFQRFAIHLFGISGVEISDGLLDLCLGVLAEAEGFGGVIFFRRVHGEQQLGKQLALGFTDGLGEDAVEGGVGFAISGEGQCRLAVIGHPLAAQNLGAFVPSIGVG